MPPKDEFERLQSEIQDLVDELWQVPRFSRLRRGFRPQVDVYRTEDPAELHVVVELPGVDPDEVRIFADDRTLVVAGNRSRLRVEGRYQHMEIEYGAFQRGVSLGVRVDPGRARAQYRRGLLTIVLPVASVRAATEKVTIPVEGRA
ncbi:MAG: Hsp20/alpha crystallin family protein [Gaiellaceae bacterium]